MKKFAMIVASMLVSFGVHAAAPAAPTAKAEPVKAEFKKAKKEVKAEEITLAVSVITPVESCGCNY